VIGDFSESVPNNEALDAIRALLSMGVAYGHIKANYRLILHREGCEANNNKEASNGKEKASSPGEKFYDELKTWPNFDI
jgi:hypothetical protein